ncbi:MAG: DUF4199 domain-containing protein [Bacteroides sp.]|nr:DUF4199 domain-containing protein [Roseburia sp.]MCM1347522.1 DUF4199 domain-containing protein [Bacteroides sp.]MCM1422000.1 DUF4199 domain-containing protein [Bacteroides sp.]
MTEQKPLMPSRAYATEYGTFLGIAWVVVFALYVYGVCNMEPLSMLMASVGICMLPFVAFYFAWRYKQHLEPGSKLPFFSAWIFSLMMFVYASLFTGAAEYVYFAYMDDGALLGQFYSVIDTGETKDLYGRMGQSDLWTVIKDTLDSMSKLSPLDMALMLFNQNIFVSFILSVPTAFVASMKSKNR